jgi:hypothetical protein
MPFSYEITPRPVDLGDGWRLRLLEDGEEVGGGVFPIVQDAPQQGVTWWNQLTEQVRAEWLAVAASAGTADAWLAYLRAEAYTDAEGEAYAWLNFREA